MRFLALLFLAPLAAAQTPVFGRFAPTVSDSLDRPALIAQMQAADGTYVPSTGGGTHCVCREVTFIGHGEETTVTYQLCNVDDLRALRAILYTGHAMGFQTFSRTVPCPQ